MQLTIWNDCFVQEPNDCFVQEPDEPETDNMVLDAPADLLQITSGMNNVSISGPVSNAARAVIPMKNHAKALPPAHEGEEKLEDLKKRIQILESQNKVLAMRTKELEESKSIVSAAFLMATDSTLRKATIIELAKHHGLSLADASMKKEVLVRALVECPTFDHKAYIHAKYNTFV